MKRLLILGSLLVLIAIGAAGSGKSSSRGNTSPSQDEDRRQSATSTQSPKAPSSSPPKSEGVEVLVGAGDIAGCDHPSRSERTAKLLDHIPGTVFAAGDLAYDKGTEREFANCYSPTWGRHKARTKPAPGNHEYDSSGAAGYFKYWGSAAGDPQKGYYSYDLGAWHIVVLNSNCPHVAGGCEAGSSQEKWLREDLAAHPAPCTLAYWHHPLFSSGEHGSEKEMKASWQALYDAGADVVINGHDHDYERFAPQDSSGKADPERGIREFVVGTGGKDHRPFLTLRPNSEVRNNGTYGVLKLTLHSQGYEWKFIPEAGRRFTDSGSGTCHKAGTAPGATRAGPSTGSLSFRIVARARGERLRGRLQGLSCAETCCGANWHSQPFNFGGLLLFPLGLCWQADGHM